MLCAKARGTRNEATEVLACLAAGENNLFNRSPAPVPAATQYVALLPGSRHAQAAMGRGGGAQNPSRPSQAPSSESDLHFFAEALRMPFPLRTGLQRSCF